MGRQISIHALRVEGDVVPVIVPEHLAVISIHALRVEGDATTWSGWWISTNFYPRPPGGGRPILLRREIQGKEFLSTPSGWRATLPAPAHDPTVSISIHALRVEGDVAELPAAGQLDISIHALRVEGDKSKQKNCS